MTRLTRRRTLALLGLPALAAIPATAWGQQKMTTPSGLTYTDLAVGTGPSPQPGQRVTVHYTGTLVDGRPERQRFGRLVQDLIGRAGEDGRPVRVYGGMVTLLTSGGMFGTVFAL